MRTLQRGERTGPVRQGGEPGDGFGRPAETCG